jgi:hypothetical protein
VGLVCCREYLLLLRLQTRKGDRLLGGEVVCDDERLCRLLLKLTRRCEIANTTSTHVNDGVMRGITLIAAIGEEGGRVTNRAPVQRLILKTN